MPATIEKLAADMTDRELLDAAGGVSNSNVGSALQKLGNALGEIEADDVKTLDQYKADEVHNLSGEDEERFQRNHAKWTALAQTEDRLQARARREVDAHQEAAEQAPERVAGGIDGVGGFVKQAYEAHGIGQLQMPRHVFAGTPTGEILEREGVKLELAEFGYSRPKFVGMADGEYTVDKAPPGMEALVVTRGQSGVERPELTVPLIYRMFDIARIAERCTIYSTEDANKIKVMRMNQIASGATGTVSVPWGKIEFIAEGAEIKVHEPTFTSIELEAHKLAWMIILANEFMRDRTPGDIESEITGQCAVKAGLDVAHQIAAGGGGSAPSGVNFALDSTGTHVTGVHTASRGATSVFSYAPVFDDFFTIIHSLAESYVPNADFWTSWANLGEIRRLKDDDGNYLLNREPGSGRWNRMLEGHEFICSPGVPRWGDNAQGPLLFGDFAAGVAVRFAGGLNIEYSPHFAFDKDSEAIRVKQEFDVDVQDPNAIVVFDCNDT